MKRTLLAVTLVGAMAQSASAAVSSITAIFGVGGPDSGSPENTANNIQLELRAQARIDSSYPELTPNAGEGTYSLVNRPGNLGPFNCEWSINSDMPAGSDPGNSDNFYLAGRQPEFFSSKKDCEEFVKAKKRVFEADQRAQKEVFNSVAHTKSEKDVFNANQKADKDAFENQQKAEKEGCKVWDT